MKTQITFTVEDEGIQPFPDPPPVMVREKQRRFGPILEQVTGPNWYRIAEYDQHKAIGTAANCSNTVAYLRTRYTTHEFRMRLIDGRYMVWARQKSPVPVAEDKVVEDKGDA